jgi:hypothetical protein
MVRPQPQVGDVLVVRTGKIWGRLVRLGAAFSDSPNLVDHVAIVHHRDDSGTLWVIEGRPGGVGYADAKVYLDSPYTLNNIKQAKTVEQRAQIAEVAGGMLGRPYDWAGIVADAMTAIDATALWAQDWGKQGPPAQVVCSSLAAWVYNTVALDHPTYRSLRLTTPSNWESWILENQLNDDD